MTNPAKTSLENLRVKRRSMKPKPPQPKSRAEKSQPSFLALFRRLIPQSIVFVAMECPRSLNTSEEVAKPFLNNLLL
ncbi:hypothetical protein TWF730_011328 [Orbilia blumenaviensis]|uniref:Uncharacterized protein n=1 Tax=Orbilia blumenaviensis TaxID=1796055 RepID=A0AAV9UNP5_9PEZI